ncbi:AraC family transcriptional regulator [Confluentibacter sediminis]|uniref:AraC family transcriptional regulator n=1 Tax=Confluentibacter sediminis TaxID=2219045 RepID=UPI000DAD7323|nr:AraC family transcriptional regulator [Confluentibacter sediminis]
MILTEKDYIKRINSALEFIDTNLDQDLSLESVSKIACYSPYHFHRIFKAIIGEPLNVYIIRLRIEKAASVLMHKKEMDISNLFLQYGFNSHSSFTRAFKKIYGISPSEFKKQSSDKNSKICKVESKNGQQNLIFEKYICSINNHLNWIEMNAKIEIKDMPKMNFAAILHRGVDGLENTFERLIKWGNSKGLLDKPETKVGRIFHDSFKITAPDKLRMSVSLLTHENIVAEGEIHKISINKSKCIVGHFEVAHKDFEKSWRSLFIWMADNGYKKANENPFEIYHNDFRQHPEGKAVVDLYIPIE